MRAMNGEDLGPFYVTPAFPGLQNNILRAFEEIWFQPPPDALVEACRNSSECSAGADNQSYLQ
jgi:hypothetical protein